MSLSHLHQPELAQRWGVSESTLERWRMIGIGPLFLKLQGRVLYRLDDIVAYEAQCLRKSTSQRVSVGITP